MKELSAKSGLNQNIINQINNIFAKYPQIKKVMLYGSRAKGNYKKGSDIDLSMFGEDLTYKIQLDVFDDLDELLLPYKIDLSVFDCLDNANLRDHIERVGVVFYEREISGLPKGWEMRKLGEVCEVITKGTTPTSIGYKFTDKGINFIKVESLTESGEIIPNKVAYINEECHKALKRSQLKVNDILFSIAGALGRIVIVRDEIVPANTNQALAIIRLKNDSGILVNYLAKYFNSNLITDEIENLRGGAAQQNLSLTQLNELEVLIPPLPEQKRIVAILDQAFLAINKAKANAEANLKNAKELFESYLQGVFENKGEGWEENKLGEIAFVKSGGTPSRAKKEYWEGNIAWYSSGELNDLYTKDPERHINELAINNSNAKIFPKGSLLIGMYDTAALKMSITDRDATFNQAIAGVKPNDKIDLIFILHSINSIKPDLLNLRRGVRQKNLSLEKIKNIPIFLPTIKVQQTIVKKLDALSTETKKLEAIYNQKINDLEELKKSVLQKAFAGQLIMDN
jgi:type I restriction enzyme S subunit